MAIAAHVSSQGYRGSPCFVAGSSGAALAALQGRGVLSERRFHIAFALRHGIACTHGREDKKKLTQMRLPLLSVELWMGIIVVSVVSVVQL